jgi:hypothetical protein
VLLVAYLTLFHLLFQNVVEFTAKKGKPQKKIEREDKKVKKGSHPTKKKMSDRHSFKWEATKASPKINLQY